MTSSLRRLTTVLMTALLVLTGSLVVAGPASATISCNSRGTSIGSGGTLLPNDCLKSGDGRYVLKMQYDGNFVLYQNSTNRACWASSWEGSYRAGDQAYVFTENAYAINRLVVSVGAGPWYNPFNKRWYQNDYDLKSATTGRTYNLSVNNLGQMWVGYTNYARC